MDDKRRHSLSWLERSLHMREVRGSSPFVSTKKAPCVGAFFWWKKSFAERLCSRGSREGAKTVMLVFIFSPVATAALPPRVADSLLSPPKKAPCVGAFSL